MAKPGGYYYRREEILVDEADLIIKAAEMPVKRSIKAKLVTISYVDMKAAVEKALGREFTYGCHGNIFDISRHPADSPYAERRWR